MVVYSTCLCVLLYFIFPFIYFPFDNENVYPDKYLYILLWQQTVIKNANKSCILFNVKGSGMFPSETKAEKNLFHPFCTY